MSQAEQLPCMCEYGTLDAFLSTTDSNNIIAGYIAIQEIMEHFRITPEMIIMKGKWFTASEIAQELSISSQRVGRIINKLRIKDNPDFVRCAIIKVQPNKCVLTFYYNFDVLSLLRSQLNLENNKK